MVGVGIIRIKETDKLAVWMRNRYPERVSLGAPMLNYSATGHVSAVDINVDGLTDTELVEAGLSIYESELLLSQGEIG